MKEINNNIKQIIYLYWFNKKGKYGNFGDELGPYLIEKISGNQIYQIKINRTGFKLILAYLKGLFFGHYNLNIYKNIIKTLKLNGNHIISIGSIIGWGSGRRIVWGSGILFKNEKISDGKFLAVRGKYTQKRLLELGYDCPSIFGDPALLLPLVYNPIVQKTHKVGMIPHHTQYKHFANYEKKHGIKVINLIGDIEDIIIQILSCENIISSSLHGLIVPHAYGIPSLWYEYPKIKWKGENIKFLDYFSSVGIKEYDPIILKEIEKFNINEELVNFAENSEFLNINSDLKNIQNKLLEAAPFHVLKEIFNCKQNL